MVSLPPVRVNPAGQVNVLSVRGPALLYVMGLTMFTAAIENLSPGMIVSPAVP